MDESMGRVGRRRRRVQTEREDRSGWISKGWWWMWKEEMVELSIVC